MPLAKDAQNVLYSESNEQKPSCSTPLLDLMSVSVAGMRDGVGPLLTVFLIQNTKLDPQHLSWLLAAPSFMNILAQIPVGIILDKTTNQSRIVALGGVLMALAAFGISVLPPFQVMFAVQLVAGLACCLVSVGIPAVSLSVVSAERFGTRLARNEIFSKIGNFGALALTGFLCQSYSLHAMFHVTYFFALILVATSLAIRNSTSKSTDESDLPIKSTAVKYAAKKRVDRRRVAEVAHSVWLNKPFRTLILICFFYQFANASLFLIFEQSFVRQQQNGGAGILSSSLFGTQVVIILASLALAKWTKHINAFKLLGLGFVMITIRALTFASQLGLVSLAISQLFDGCVAAILIIVPVRAIAYSCGKDFNVLSGVLGTCVAFGAMLSTLVAGYLIGSYGFVPAFAAFGIVAIGGVVLVSSTIRNTGNHKQVLQ